MNSFQDSFITLNDSPDSLSASDLQLAVQAIVEHLRRESAYLDTVIACSLKLKDLLNRPSVKVRANLPPKTSLRLTESAATGDLAMIESGRSIEGLTTLRGDLARQFLPLIEGRQQLQSALQHFEPLFDAPPTLRDLAPRLAVPIRNELNQLRHDIKTKLQEVQAITMGNQAVLIYTLDFYHRLITGITGESPAPQAYNSHGQMTTPMSSSLLQKEC